MQLLTDVITETGPTLGALTGDMNRITKLVGERLPAFSTYLPALTDLGDGIPHVVHDGALVVLADLFPRDMCDYGTPRRSPTIGGTPAPRTDRYCTTYGPELQQRGAYNAPRPGGDDTAGPGARSASGSGSETATRDTSRSTSTARAAATPTYSLDWYESYLALTLGIR